MSELIPSEKIKEKIFVIRGHKVMIDKDLAELYGVLTKSLNLAIKRNSTRFPDDFMFRLTHKEAESLRFQIETSKKGRGACYGESGRLHFEFRCVSPEFPILQTIVFRKSKFKTSCQGLK